MSKKSTYTRDTNKPFDDSDIDYSIIDSMTEDDVHKGAVADVDAQPVTEKQSEEFRRVTPPKGIDK